MVEDGSTTCCYAARISKHRFFMHTTTASRVRVKGNMHNPPVPICAQLLYNPRQTGETLESWSRFDRKKRPDSLDFEVEVFVHTDYSSSLTRLKAKKQGCLMSAKYTLFGVNESKRKFEVSEQSFYKNDTACRLGI